MRYQTISKQEAFRNWSGVIKEAVKGVQLDENKVEWVSTLLQINENEVAKANSEMLNEHYGAQGPEAVQGMGSVAWGGVGQAHGDIMKPDFNRGSGDVPNRQMSFAMNVACYTIGLDLLPVLPLEFPSIMFGYLDTVYNARLDQTQAQQGETEIYLQLMGDRSGYADGAYSKLKIGDKVVLGKIGGTLSNIDNALIGTYFGKHRINGDAIVRFDGLTKLTASTDKYAVGVTTDGTPVSALKQTAGASQRWAILKVVGANTEIVTDLVDQFVTSANGAVSGDLVSAVDMHIPEFSKASAKDNSLGDNYTDHRARGEKGTQNIVSLRLFSTSVEAGEVQVLGELTRIQLKDLNAYGQDGMGQLYKSAQHELTMTMNRDILRTMFRLGVTTASKMRHAQGVDLNLFIADPAQHANKDLSAFNLREFKDVNGVDRTAEFVGIKNAESNSSAENNATRARRILTRILAGSNLIGVLSRQGAGDIAVVNAQIATAIQDISMFTPNPVQNDITLDKRSLYSIGTVQGGVRVYVDPEMDWNDTRIMIGRKGDEMSSGLKMFIYTLGDTVETLDPKSMAPKILVSSRYALVPCGFFPEVNYLTIAVDNEYGLV